MLEIRPSGSLNVPSFVSRLGSASQTDFDALDAEVTALQSEVVTARSGKPNLDERIDNVVGDTINAVPHVTSVGAESRFAVTSSSDSYLLKNIEWEDIKARLYEGIGQWVGSVFTAKATISTSDHFVIADSADSNEPKRVTWATLKADATSATAPLASFTALQTEVVNARSGQSSLDDRIDGISDDLVATGTEVINARGGQDNLQDRIDGISADLVETGTEIITARSGKSSLDARIDAIVVDTINAATHVSVVGSEARFAVADDADGYNLKNYEFEDLRSQVLGDLGLFVKSVYPEKSTLVDADDFLVADSQAVTSDLIPKHINYSSLKAGITEEVIDSIASVGEQLEDLPLSSRPGRDPRLFSWLSTDGLTEEQVTAALSGTLNVFEPVPAGMIVVDGQDGAEVRVIGPVNGPGVIFMREAFRIESDGLYKIVAKVRRRSNSTDPANDAVQIGVQPLNAFQGAVGSPMVVETLTTLTVASGRVTHSDVIATTAATGVTIVAPVGAIYGRLYVRFWGNEATTSLQMLEETNVADNDFVSPDVAALEAELDALQSEDLPTRVEALETAIGTGSEIIRFPERADAEAATIGVTVDIVEVLSDTASPGVIDVFHRTGAGPASDEIFQSADGAWWLRESTQYTAAPTGAVARPYIQKFAESISMLDFIPWTTAADIDMPAGTGDKISAYLEEAGRKVLRIPARKFTFSEGAGTGGDFYTIDARGASDISIIGEGPEVSILRVADGSDVGGISIGAVYPSLVDIHNINLHGFTIDCNRANNLGLDGVHGFRFGGYHEHLRLSNMVVKNTVSYGIGFQSMNSGANGYYKHVKLSNIYVENAGNDGIDFKNPEFVNEDIQLDNITINGFNVGGDETEQAGIDIRGPAQLNNIRVSMLSGRDHSGIRFRHGDVAEMPGGEAQQSGVSNFWVRMITNWPVNRVDGQMTLGVDMEADNCYAVNGYVKDCDRGIDIGAVENCKVAHVVTEGCGTGFSSLSTTSMFEDVTAIASTDGDIEVGLGTRFSNSQLLTAPTREIISAFMGSGGLTGILRNEDNEIDYLINGDVDWRFDATRRLRAQPSLTAPTHPAFLQIPSGGTNYAMAVRSVDTSACNVFSFETPSGILMTMIMSSAAIQFKDADGTPILTMANNSIGFHGALTTKPTGVAVTVGAIHAALVTLGLIAA